MALSERGLTIGPRVPRGLASAVEGLAREILRYRPQDVYTFAAHHFEQLVELRENGRAAVNVSKIFDRASSKEKHRILFDWICRDKYDSENDPCHDRYRRSNRKNNGLTKEASIKETTRIPSASKLLARRRRRRRGEEETTNRSGWSINETVKAFKKYENDARKGKSKNIEKSIETEVRSSHQEQRSPRLSKTIARCRFLRSLSVGDVYLARNISRCLEKNHEKLCTSNLDHSAISVLEDTKRNNECNKHYARTLKRQRSADHIGDTCSLSRVRHECVYNAAPRSHSLVNVVPKGRGSVRKEDMRHDQLTGNTSESFETYPLSRQVRRESFPRGLEAKERKRLEEEKARGSTETASKLNFRTESDETMKDNDKAERVDATDGATGEARMKYESASSINRKDSLDNPESVMLPLVITKQNASWYPEDTVEQNDPNHLVLPPISSDASKPIKKEDNLLSLPLLSKPTETIETNRPSAIISDRQGTSADNERKRHSEPEASTSDIQDFRAENNDDQSIKIERSCDPSETANASEREDKEEIPKFKEYSELDVSTIETRNLKTEANERPSDRSHGTINEDECKEEVLTGSKDDSTNVQPSLKELSQRSIESFDNSSGSQQSGNEEKLEESCPVVNELKSKLIEIEMVEKNIENTLISSETVLISDADHEPVASAAVDMVTVADAALKDVDKDSLDSPVENQKQFDNGIHGSGSKDTVRTTKTQQPWNDEDLSCYVLTEGSPCEIPESVTTVIIPDKESESDDEMLKFDPEADSFGEHIMYPVKTFEYSTNTGMEFLRNIEDAVDRTISRQDLGNIKEEEEGTEKDVSDNTKNLRTHSTDVELESLERDEDATTETTDNTSNQEQKEATSNDGEHMLLSDITEPCVPELNLSSFRDTTTSSADDRSDSMNSENRSKKEDKGDSGKNATHKTEITLSSIDSLSGKENTPVVGEGSSSGSKIENEALSDHRGHSVENDDDKSVQMVANDQNVKESPNVEEEIARELMGENSLDEEEEITTELIGKDSPNVEEAIARKLIRKDSSNVEEDIARELIEKNSLDEEEEEIKRELIGKDSSNVEEDIARELIEKNSLDEEEEAIARKLIRKDSSNVEEDIARELIGKDIHDVEGEITRGDSPHVEEEITRELIEKDSPGVQEAIARELIRKDSLDVEEEIAKRLIRKDSLDVEEEITKQIIRKDSLDVEEEIAKELIGTNSPNVEEEIAKELIQTLTDEMSMLKEIQDTTETTASSNADELSNFCSTSQLNATVSDKQEMTATETIEPVDISMISSLNGVNHQQENVHESIQKDKEDNETKGEEIASVDRDSMDKTAIDAVNESVLCTDSNSNDTIEKTTIKCEESSENLDQSENSEKLLTENPDQTEKLKDPVTASNLPTMTLDAAAKVIQIWVRKFLIKHRLSEKFCEEQNHQSGTPNTTTVLNEISQLSQKDIELEKDEGFVISNDESNDLQKSEESQASEVSGSGNNEVWPPMVTRENMDDEQAQGVKLSTSYSSRHTGEFHDSLPLPVLEISKDEMLKCMQESAKPMRTSFFNPGSPQACVLLAFGFPNSLLDDGPNWSKSYVGFSPSVAHTNKPDFKREANLINDTCTSPTKEHSDSDVDSIREPLALDSTSKSILIEEITTTDDEKEHHGTPQDSILQECTSSPVNLVDSDNQKNIEKKEGTLETSDESKST